MNTKNPDSHLYDSVYTVKEYDLSDWKKIEGLKSNSPELKVDPVLRNAAVDHPDHYGGADNPYEAIKVIKAWDLGFCLGNTVKYISRAGKKDRNKRIEDLRKAVWYLEQQINYEVLDEFDRSTPDPTRNK
jgi:hypothetical protein